MSEWLAALGGDEDEVRTLFEVHLQSLVIKNFGKQTKNKLQYFCFVNDIL